jgi:hypothetical protein
LATIFKRSCPECAQGFATPRVNKLFCSSPCQIKHNNRQLQRGQRLVSLAQAWRAGKDIARPDKSKNPSAEAKALKTAAKEAFDSMCRELDAMTAEDRAAGRMHPTALYLKRERIGLLDHSGVLGS